MIAVCITTYNRPDTLYETLAHHLAYLPDDARIYIHDDGSNVENVTKKFDTIKAICDRHDASDRVVYWRCSNNYGVAASKNECLFVADDWGADHIFLFDDDTYPIVRSWEKPYIEHKEPHLMYQFKLPGKPKTDMRELYRDDKTVAYSHTRGAMLYIERRALDVVGGFDTAYGKGGYEHPDWTNRIHNAGLTTHRAMDVPNSDKLLYCLDQDGMVRSSMEPDSKARRMRDAHKLYIKNKTSAAFKDYK